MQDNNGERRTGHSVNSSKRPDISEVIRSLRAAGSVDVAERIVAMTGINPAAVVVVTDTTSQGESEHDNSNGDAPSRRSLALSRKSTGVSKSGDAAQEPTKYLRGRYRFAYIYVNSTKASLDEQSKMLSAFLKEARVLRKACAFKIYSKHTPWEPVKLMASTPGWFTSGSPMTLPRPMTRLKTPAGMPLRLMISARAHAQPGTRSAGLKTTQLP